MMKPVITKNIPKELSERPQWVCWKAVPKENGKFDKIPKNPRTGKNASHSNPKTWGRYDEAQSYYQKHKTNGIDGIGYVFSKHDPFCGIDLDACRSIETGKIEDWAKKILSIISLSYKAFLPKK